MNYKNYNDYEIVYMIGENNEDALDILYHKYEPIVKSYAKKYSFMAKRYGVELEDLIQEGRYAIYRALKTYNTAHDTLFYTYVDFCIRGRMCNLLRLSNSRGSYTLNNSVSLNDFTDTGSEYMYLIPDDAALNPHDCLIESETCELIKKYLYSLDFCDSGIFELRMNGFKNREIARLLDIDSTFVSRKIYKLKQDFKKFILNYKNT